MLPMTVKELSAEERGRILQDLLRQLRAGVPWEQLAPEYEALVTAPQGESFNEALMPEAWIND